MPSQFSEHNCDVAGPHCNWCHAEWRGVDWPVTMCKQCVKKVEVDAARRHLRYSDIQPVVFLGTDTCPELPRHCTAGCTVMHGKYGRQVVAMQSCDWQRHLSSFSRWVEGNPRIFITIVSEGISCIGNSGDRLRRQFPPSSRPLKLSTWISFVPFNYFPSDAHTFFYLCI